MSGEPPEGDSGEVALARFTTHLDEHVCASGFEVGTDVHGGRSLSPDEIDPSANSISQPFSAFAPENATLAADNQQNATGTPVVSFDSALAASSLVIAESQRRAAAAVASQARRTSEARAKETIETQVLHHVRQNARVLLMKVFALFDAFTGTSDAKSCLDQTRSSVQDGSGSNNKERVSESLSFALDQVFRFAFEEISLRWNSLEEKPFSVGMYNYVMKKQVDSRVRAEQGVYVKSRRIELLEDELTAALRSIERRDEQRATLSSQYFTELLLLRQRLEYLHRKMEIRESIPRFLDLGTDGAAEEQLREEERQDLEYLNSKLSEESQLLQKTLEERRLLVQSLEEELANARKEYSRLRMDFTEYLGQQEGIDARFLKAMNEYAEISAAAKAKNEQLQASVAELTEKIVEQLQATEAKAVECTSLEYQLENLREKLANATTANAAAVEDAKKAAAMEQQVISAMQASAEAAKKEETSKVQKDEEARKKDHQEIEKLSEQNKKLQAELQQAKATIAAGAKEREKILKDAQAQLAELETAKMQIHATQQKGNEEVNAQKKRDAAAHQRTQLELEALKKDHTELEKNYEEFVAQHLEEVGELRRTEESLVDDLMLLHRQIAISEQFIRKKLSRKDWRELTSNLADPQYDTAMNTPRTVSYFASREPLTAEELQERLYHADLGNTVVLVDTMSEKELRSENSMLMRSRVTLDYIKNIAGRRGSLGIPLTLPGSRRVSIASTVATNENSVIDNMAATQREVDGDNQQMIIEDLLSQRIALAAEHEELKAEFDAQAEELSRLRASPERAPALLALRAHRRSPSPPGGDRRSSRVMMDGAMNAPSSRRKSSCFEDIETAKMRYMSPGSPTALQKRVQELSNVPLDVSILQCFPGVEDATDYYDVFAAFNAMRLQLLQLVSSCAREARLAAEPTAPSDIKKDVQLERFLIFRAIEAHSASLVQRLSKKKDDIMCKQEESIEKVLGAMQNISLTHPKEARRLLRVAKTAAASRAAGMNDIRLTAVVERPATSLAFIAPRPSTAAARSSGTPEPIEGGVVYGCSSLLSRKGGGSQQRPVSSCGAPRSSVRKK